MMKYDNPITPNTRRRTDVIKCLNDAWRGKSLPPPDGCSPPKTTNTSPKSPISKAFDFLPWPSKHKSTTTSKTNPQNPTTVEQNYHKNIFRNSGGIIRDILSDKLNKDKGNQHHHGNGKKFKYTSRNKSFDINELINNCTIEDYGNYNNENDDNENDNIYRKNGFIDDTYIEELMDSNNNNHDNNNNNSDNVNNNNGKHILFNNENVVHIFNGKKSSCSVEKSNGTSIIKARLKLQKLKEPTVSATTANTNQKSILTRNSVPSPSKGNLPSNHPALNYQRSKSEIVIENRSSNENDVERPKTVKPRKKLSFREPVASHLRMKFQDGRFQVENVNNKKQQGNGGGGPPRSASACDSDLESQAMRVVSTVGQAFEVCHQFNLQKNSLDNNDETSDLSFELYDSERRSQNSDDDSSKKDQLAITPDISIQAPPQRPNHLELGTHLNRSNNINNHKSSMSDGEKSPTSPTLSSSNNEVQKLKEQLEQQALQTRQALAQLIMVREQLISETNARMEAQARTQQLLQQNRELLEHLASLGAYTEPQQQSLTAANIAMAPQSHLSMTNMMSNNNLASINQQINNLGSINQQLTNLSHQLNGINQQQQQTGFQNYSAQAQTPNNNGSQPTMNQLQNISNQLSNISVQNNQEALNKELYHMNQDLLNRLQSMNLGMNHLTAGTPNNNSLFFANPMSCSPSNNSNLTTTNMNFLSTPSSYGNLTPSPVGTLNRNSFSASHSPLPMINSTDGLGLSIDKNLNNLEDNGHIMKSRLGLMGNHNQSNNNISDSTRSDSSSSPLKLSDQRLNNIANNTVMLKVTDEAGNVTNTRKLSATPSFIQRSTSEKVPNRSQMMSQVQRTQWARHTTK